MAKIGELIINLKANTAAFASDIKKVSDISFSSAKNIEKSFRVIGVAALAAFTAVKAAMIAIAVDTANYGHELVEASQKTGIAVEQLSALRLAADQSDISFDVLIRGIGIFAKNLAGLQSTTSKSAVAMRAMFGDDFQSKIRDAGGNLKPLHELLLMVSDRFRTVKDSGEKAAISMASFGRGGLQYIPLLNSNLRELEARFKQLGITWSLEDALAAQTFHDQLKILTAELQGVEFRIGKGLIPNLIASVTWFENAGLKVEEYGLRLASAVKFGDALAASMALQPLLALKFWDEARKRADEAAGVEVKFQAALSRTASMIAAQTKAALIGMAGAGDNLHIPVAPDKKQEELARATERYGDILAKLRDKVEGLTPALERYRETLRNLTELQTKGVNVVQGEVAAGFVFITERNKELTEATEKTNKAVAEQIPLWKQDALGLALYNNAVEAAVAIPPPDTRFPEQIAETLKGLNTQILELGKSDLQITVDRLKGLGATAGEIQGATEMIRGMHLEAREFGREMSSAFSQMIVYGKGFREVLQSLLVKIADLIIQAYVFKSLANSLSGMSGFWGQLGGFFAGLAGAGGASAGVQTITLPTEPGWMASGGPVSARIPYLVGERGPELFVPDVSGTIVPSGKSLGTQVVYNIDARGADAGVERRILRALKAVHGSAIQNAQLAMQDRMLRSGA